MLFLASAVLLCAAIYWYADRIVMGMVGARELLPGLPILFITGYAGTAIAGDELPAGMRVLSKPFGNDALAAEVAVLLASEPSLQQN